MTPDVLIIGAGAAGLMCAIEAGKRGRRVVVIDHSEKIAEKIRISGGGRCNFTNLYCAPDRYLSENPHFCTSALRRYTQHDFIDMVKRHSIAFHEKTLGQLFCDHSAKDIIKMLLDECDNVGAEIYSGTHVRQIEKTDDGFIVQTDKGDITASSLVIATGGPAIPKMGATGFGYEVAKQFGLNVIPARAGLVPLTFDPDVLAYTQDLSGLAVDPVRVHSKSGKTFDEAMLFTHRGISGPAVLQISSYWNPGEDITINLAPHTPVLPWLKKQRQQQPRSMIHTILSELLPKRLAQKIADDSGISGKMADLSDKILIELTTMIDSWRIKPSGSEGYRTAEVALGGIDTKNLSSKTFEANDVKNLYFIGEVIDVTGHLGGFNFQWAWSSGWCAGQYV
jgi:predicted Rossmann fold flavoprotein